jgi:hypothetical protein
MTPLPSVCRVTPSGLPRHTLTCRHGASLKCHLGPRNTSHITWLKALYLTLMAVPCFRACRISLNTLPTRPLAVRLSSASVFVTLSLRLRRSCGVCSAPQLYCGRPPHQMPPTARVPFGRPTRLRMAGVSTRRGHSSWRRKREIAVSCCLLSGRWPSRAGMRPVPALSSG